MQLTMKIIITCVDVRFRAEYVDANGAQVDVCLVSLSTPEYLIARIRQSKTWFENMQDDE